MKEKKLNVAFIKHVVVLSDGPGREEAQGIVKSCAVSEGEILHSVQNMFNLQPNICGSALLISRGHESVCLMS